MTTCKPGDLVATGPNKYGDVGVALVTANGWNVKSRSVCSDVKPAEWQYLSMRIASAKRGNQPHARSVHFCSYAVRSFSLSSFWM
mgnify:CR=1 FL=1